MYKRNHWFIQAKNDGFTNRHTPLMPFTTSGPEVTFINLYLTADGRFLLTVAGGSSQMATG